VASIRQVHRTGPTTKAVTAENENLHLRLLNERMLRRANYYRPSSPVP